ncbi:MAG: amidohydrolase family protein [bacterium]|nr:amidohydrolase family protein [bacterium]
MRGEFALVGGVIFTGRAVLKGQALLVGEGVVRGLVPPSELPREIEQIDVAGRLILPGFVNAHHHAYSALATGMPSAAARNFREVLEQVWWRLDKALDEEALALSARWTALQCLQHGVTTLIDHHASYGVVRGALEIVQREFEACGLSSVVCFEISGRHGRAAAMAALEENLSFRPGPRGARLIGLHAGFTLDDELLREVGERVPDDVGFHIHCAEDVVDVANAQGQLLERLARFGIVRRQSLLVHGVHLREDELERVARSGAALVHCPESNMHNGVGSLDLVRATALGVRVVCGTDGLHSSMLRSYAAAYLLARHTRRDAGVGFAETGRMYTSTQGLARSFWPDSSGEIEVGKRADLVVLAYQPHTPITTENAWGHVLYGAPLAPVQMTISGGVVRYADGCWPGWDMRSITAACTRAAERVWARLRVT